MPNPGNISFELSLRSQAAAFGFPTGPRDQEDYRVAFGGDLNPVRLLVAYANGVFPWPDPSLPLIPWCSPSPRTVLIPGSIHIGRSTAKLIRQERLEISFDTAFKEVIHSCAAMKRAEGNATWISGEMISAYVQLHEQGFAHSVEAWRAGRLIGGVYGVSLGAAFFGESMFRTEPNASKIALIALAERLAEWRFPFLDCQVRTPIANSLGAVDWDRAGFQSSLVEALNTPTRRTGWRRDPEVFAPIPRTH